MTNSEYLRWKPSRVRAKNTCLFKEGDVLSLGQIVNAAEWTDVELKRDMSEKSLGAVAKYICSFRNGAGGCICFGVQEHDEGTAKIVGVSVADVDLVKRRVSECTSVMCPRVSQSDLEYLLVAVTGSTAVVFAVKVKASQEDVCTQTTRECIPFFRDGNFCFSDDYSGSLPQVQWSGKMLGETRKLYFPEDSKPSGMVDVLSFAVLYPVGSGWMVRPSFFRPSSPLSSLA